MAPTNSKASSTKKKVAVGAKKSQQVKVRLNKSIPLPPAKPLAEDWPVTSRPPTLKPTDSALRPGSLLQEICNGQDIHLNKQALQAPSISKEKGRYLLILPGNMSFRGIKNSTQPVDGEITEVKNTAQQSVVEDALEQGEDLATQKSVEEGDDEEEGEEGAAKASGISNKMNVPQLGKIEGLSTANPKFRIAFPDSNKSLVFPGTKVNTLSKYIWLNCSSRKKGTVACKGIFTSAIVFGAPAWETNGEEVAGDVVAPCNGRVVDDNAWMHYGGSERTLDGVFKGSKKNKSMETSQPITVPIVSKEPIFDERGIPKPSRMSIHSAKPAPSQLTTTPDAEALSDASDDDDYTLKADLPVAKERTVPKRRASGKRRQYTSDLLDSDVEQEISSEGEGGNEVTTKRRGPTQKKSKEQHIRMEDGSSDAAENVAKRAPRGRKSSSDSSDDDDFSIANDNVLSISTSSRRLSSRSSAKKRSYKEKEESDEESAGNDLPVKAAPKSRKAVATGRRSSAPNSRIDAAAERRKVGSGGRLKSDPIDLAGDDESEKQELTTTNTSFRGAKTPSSTSAKSSRKDVPASVLEGVGIVTSVSASKEKNTMSSTGRKSKSHTLEIDKKGDENQSEVINVDELESSKHKATTKAEKCPSVVPKRASAIESPSISSASSPFRARRRKSASAPKPSSAKRSAFDLTAEFQFE